jgi:hypothetical protein
MGGWQACPRVKERVAGLSQGEGEDGRSVPGWMGWWKVCSRVKGRLTSLSQGGWDGGRSVPG